MGAIRIRSIDGIGSSQLNRAVASSREEGMVNGGTGRGDDAVATATVTCAAGINKYAGPILGRPRSQRPTL